MIYTTKQNKNSIIKKTIKTICVAIFWLLIWEIASRVVSYNNQLLLLILPSPITVFKKWLTLVFTASFAKSILYTLLRIFLGYILGVAFGFALGVATHISNIIYSVLSPMLKIIRAVPVVATIILLYLFFNTSTLPILIVFLMVLPLIWQSVHDGLKNTDNSLLEMAAVYRLSTAKAFYLVKLPQIIPTFITACINALGLAWKSGIAAEVICLPDISLGLMLWQSKGNVNFDEVYALTITVVILSTIIEYLIKFLCRKLIFNYGGNMYD